MPKINRALTWIRKALDVTQKTSAPTAFLDDIRTVVDALGWERLNETVTSRNTGTATNVIDSGIVPEGVLRLVLSASVELNDTVQAFTVWVEHSDGTTAGSPAVMRPIQIPISAISIHAGIERIIVMREGDTMRARCSPNVGPGLEIRIVLRFVDLPIGEYVGNL